MSLFLKKKKKRIDKLHNFWIKKLDVMHPALTSAYNNIMKDPLLLPHWLVNWNYISDLQRTGP